MPITIALAGNPNSGKTTMFNDLTGSSQRVGNWPGVTVEKKEGKFKDDKNILIQDLPGIYSLSPYTSEEVVSRNYLLNERPDAIINIIDASNIERNLYLTTQLTELGIPVVIALNMIDIVQKNGDTIDLKALEASLGCPVVETSALKKVGSKDVVQKAVQLAKENAPFAPAHTFADDVEAVLNKIENLIDDQVSDINTRWYAIKLFERDPEVMKRIALPAELLEQVEKITADAEEEFDDDSESIITNERYNYITKTVEKSVKIKNKHKLSISDKIDKIVTNRFLGLPIFAVVMFLVYFISISTIGTSMTDFVNDGVFGDGFHLFGNGAAAYEEATGNFEVEGAKIEAFLEAADEAGIDTTAVKEALEANEEELDEAQFAENKAAIEDFLKKAAAVTATAEIENEDGEVEKTVPVDIAGFTAALEAEEPDPADFGNWVPGIPAVVEGWLTAANTAPWLNGLILEGIIGGVGAVLGFLPQMAVLFLCLALLEACGYMSRIAFVMDRIFRKFGLSGKSFIPMLISTGCGVPGIMASRTIENENDRRMTVMTTTFIPCGAKLPIIALIAGALFNGSSWVAASAYFIGMAAVIVSGIMLKKTKLFAGDPSPFIIELPAYHLPGVKSTLRSTFDRSWSFVKKAGTLVLLATTLVWFLSNFNWSMQMVETNESMLAAIGNLIAPLFSPLGWGDWRAAVATFTGLLAKENIVGTFGVLFGFGEVAENGAEYWPQLTAAFSQLAAYSFLVFNLLCAPCFAAMGALKREMMSAKWTAFAITYQCVFAYAVSLVIYQLGMLFQGNGFGIWTAVAFAVIALFIYLLVKKPYSPKKEAPKLGAQEKAAVTKS